MTERTIFALLEDIRARPGMYVGDIDDHPTIVLLHHVESYIAGYTAALRTHGIREPVEDFNRAFSTFLRDRYHWDLPFPPASMIEVATKLTGVALWLRYWGLIDEFRATIEG